MPYLIRNWERYQHYKKRNPPWVKLHTELLQSDDWILWDDASRVLAIVLMVIAPRTEGVIDDSPEALELLRKRSHLTSTPDLKPLIDSGFLVRYQDASIVLARGDRDASSALANGYSEAESETESEAESESDARAGSIDAPKKPGPSSKPRPTDPASAPRGTPDPDPEPEHLATLDSLRSALRRRDPKRYLDAERELRRIAARTADYAGIPRTHTIAAMMRALTHLETATRDGTIERWDAYLRKVVLAESQNGAAEDSAMRAKQHARDNDAAVAMLRNIAQAAHAKAAEPTPDDPPQPPTHRTRGP